MPHTDHSEIPDRTALRRLMPTLFEHAGTWVGNYRHIDADGVLLDSHATRVTCEFPEDGPIVYVQRNHFEWADGRTQDAVLNATFADGKLWWDEPTFRGYAWENEGVIFLELDRKDEPGASFRECILMGTNGHRSRTWHWIRDGQLFRRTLVDEQRVG